MVLGFSEVDCPTAVCTRMGLQSLVRYKLVRTLVQFSRCVGAWSLKDSIYMCKGWVMVAG